MRGVIGRRGQPAVVGNPEVSLVSKHAYTLCRTGRS